VSLLSIIIPHHRDTETSAFEETLASVLENRPARSEILVASNGEYSDPWDIGSDGVRIIDFPNERSPIRLLNNAIAETRGTVVQVLHPGSVAGNGWAEPALGRFDNDNVAVVAGSVTDMVFPEVVLATGVSWHCGGGIRILTDTDPFAAHFVQLAPHFANAFFRKSALDEIQHFLPRFNPQIAYIDAALLLAELNWQIVQESRSRVALRASDLQYGSDYQWSRHSEQLFWRWSDWGGSGRSLIRHLGTVSCEVFWTTLSLRPAVLLGRLSGIDHFGANRSRISDIQQILEQLEQNRLATVHTHEHVRKPARSPAESTPTLLFPPANAQPGQLADAA